MTTLFVKSDSHILRPASRAAAVELSKLPTNVPLKIEPKQPRSGKAHRLFWAFASLVADALNDGPTPMEWTQERVVTHLKLATGHVETVKLGRKDAERLGTQYAALPRSISFAKMDNAEFSRFMDAAFTYVRDELAPWISDSDHWADIAVILQESHLMGKEAA